MIRLLFLLNLTFSHIAWADAQLESYHQRLQQILEISKTKQMIDDCGITSGNQKAPIWSILEEIEKNFDQIAARTVPLTSEVRSCITDRFNKGQDKNPRKVLSFYNPQSDTIFFDYDLPKDEGFFVLLHEAIHWYWQHSEARNATIRWLNNEIKTTLKTPSHKVRYRTSMTKTRYLKEIIPSLALTNETLAYMGSICARAALNSSFLPEHSKYEPFHQIVAVKVDKAYSRSSKFSFLHMNRDKGRPRNVLLLILEDLADPSGNLFSYTINEHTRKPSPHGLLLTHIFQTEEGVAHLGLIDQVNQKTYLLAGGNYRDDVLNVIQNINWQIMPHAQHTNSIIPPQHYKKISSIYKAMLPGQMSQSCLPNEKPQESPLPIDDGNPIGTEGIHNSLFEKLDHPYPQLDIL